LDWAIHILGDVLETLLEQDFRGFFRAEIFSLKMFAEKVVYNRSS
jgi:hypothetical protein